MAIWIGTYCLVLCALRTWGIITKIGTKWMGFFYFYTTVLLNRCLYYFSVRFRVVIVWLFSSWWLWVSLALQHRGIWFLNICMYPARMRSHLSVGVSFVHLTHHSGSSTRQDDGDVASCSLCWCQRMLVTSSMHLIAHCGTMYRVGWSQVSSLYMRFAHSYGMSSI